jgi:PHD/YefM family antitoxin component YafN of YafNO toxin-antitoxin module
VDRELERFIISKRGHPVAILLSVDDYESLIETLNETEDRANLKRVKQGLAEAKKGRTVPWSQVKAKHRLP